MVVGMIRTLVPPAFALLALTLAGCTTTRADGSPQVQTSSQATRESLEGAVSAPLRDINVLRTKIPAVLLEAQADPYKRPQPATCAQLIALVTPLNQALGADLDEEAVDEDDLMSQGRSTALGAVAGLTQDVIPFRGWVRKLTGAEQHDNLVRDAIIAGGVRRAYLKGLGEARGCNPPATPNHGREKPEVIQQELKPRYPVR
jgi:predicted small secreted protein